LYRKGNPFCTHMSTSKVPDFAGSSDQQNHWAFFIHLDLSTATRSAGQRLRRGQRGCSSAAKPHADSDRHSAGLFPEDASTAQSAPCSTPACRCRRMLAAIGAEWDRDLSTASVAGIWARG
jgi:hypothetical protein